MKPVDKTKKSNIKCEHCEYYINSKFGWTCNKEPEVFTVKNYWNRCKDFKWAKRYEGGAE